MRILLILINACLVCGIGYGAYTWLNEEEQDLSKYDLPKDKDSDKPKSNVNLNASTQSFNAYDGETMDNMVRVLSNAINIFDPDRQPQAKTNATNRIQNQRVDLTLVGTFTFGDVEGAIILQRGGNNRNNMFGMGGFGMDMFGGRQNTANNRNNRNTTETQAALREAAQEQIQNYNTQIASLRQLVQDNKGDEQLVSTLNSRIERLESQSKTLAESTAKAATNRDGTLAEISAENSGTKQYIRVGETMSNGYMLTAVTRKTATLTRATYNNRTEELELTIQEASVNAGAFGRAGANNNNRQMGGFGQMGGMGGMGGMQGGMGAMGGMGGNQRGGNMGGMGGGAMGGGMQGGGMGGGMQGGGEMGAGFTGGNQRGGQQGGNQGGANMRGGNQGGNQRGGNQGGRGGR